MPPKDPCTEHGEALAVLKEKVRVLEKGHETMSNTLENIVKTLNNLRGAWVVVVILAAFLSTIAGNVVSARIIAQVPSVHTLAK